MPAPDDLMKVICCKCKSTSRNQCGTNLCSCRKNGLSRVSACEECRGVGCFNIIDIMGKEEEDHDEKERNLFYDLFL